LPTHFFTDSRTKTVYTNHIDENIYLLCDAATWCPYKTLARLFGHFQLSCLAYPSRAVSYLPRLNTVHIVVIHIVANFMCLFEPWLVFCLTFVRASSKSTSSSVCFASVMLCSCTFQRSLRGFIKTVEDREIWVIVGLKKSTKYLYSTCIGSTIYKQKQ